MNRIEILTWAEYGIAIGYFLMGYAARFQMVELSNGSIQIFRSNHGQGFLFSGPVNEPVALMFLFCCLTFVIALASIRFAMSFGAVPELDRYAISDNRVGYYIAIAGILPVVTLYQIFPTESPGSIQVLLMANMLLVFVQFVIGNMIASSPVQDSQSFMYRIDEEK